MVSQKIKKGIVIVLIIVLFVGFSQEYEAHFSEEDTIVITDAYHLDSDGNVISNIYEYVNKKDGVWSPEISDGEFVRITFEKPLGPSNDITIFPRVVFGEPLVKVYEVNGDKKIAEFTNIVSYEYNTIYLKGLTDTQKTFDLFVSGGIIEFDHIIDPSCSCPGEDQDWVIDMDDSCNIELSCNIGSGNITFTGTGNVTFNATVTAANMANPVFDQIIFIGSNAIVNITG